MNKNNIIKSKTLIYMRDDSLNSPKSIDNLVVGMQRVHKNFR
jgi:hypothetical protein